MTMTGQLLDGRYQIVGELGRGGMGIVYRAQQIQVHNRDVAIKVLNAAASTKATTAHRFEIEARIIAGLRHPNTIKLLDTGHTADGRLYIVTECLQGMALSDRLQQGKLTTVQTVKVVQQISEALIEAHEQGIVHRDLKPANVFVEDVGSQQVVKVLDFGIAKVVNAMALTAPMQLFGTPGFMAPEQCLGEPVDARTDLYALGVLAYLCLTETMPNDGQRLEDVLAATIEVDPIPVNRFLPDVPPELDGLVMQLLAKAPSDRIPDAVTVRDACIQITRYLAETDPVPIPGLDEAPSNDEPSRVRAHDSYYAPTEVPSSKFELEGLDDTVQQQYGDGPDTDALDVAPTVLPPDTVNSRIATKLFAGVKQDTRRREILRRNLTLAGVSAVVAAAIATGGLLLFTQ